MELPVAIERSPDGIGFTARLATPIELSAQAPTADEAHELLVKLLAERLEQGIEIRSLTVPRLDKADGSQTMSSRKNGLSTSPNTGLNAMRRTERGYLEKRSAARERAHRELGPLSRGSALMVGVIQV